MIRIAGNWAVVAGLTLAAPSLLPAQPPVGTPTARSEGGWNDARVAALIERGRERRAEPLADPSLGGYRAHAEGTIYFYIDPDDGEPVLMRADQVAVELYWAPPDRTRQILVGQRIEKRLPIRDFHYYLDRLTVVQNGFADEIRVGEGMDVRDVLHPLAPGAERVYDYRLADSLTLRLPGSPPVRAFEVTVRPRDMNAPGFVGSIFIDEASGALVRMSFGFTRPSYIDPRNDYVRISVDHGLWRGRYWLPHEQQVVVRREIPEIDLRAGTIIRATLRVTDYDFDAEMPADFFRWPAVTAAPRASREAFAFERGMYDDLADAGLAPGRAAQAFEADARRMAGARLASGLPVARLALPAFSEMLRYNRAEGLFLGGGARLGSPARELRVSGGHAFAAAETTLRLHASERITPGGRLQLGAFRSELRDVGPGAAAPGVLNTLAAAALGRDYLDPWRADGVLLGFEQQAGGGIVAATGSVERHRSAARVAGGALLGRTARPVRPIEEGLRHAVSLEFRRPIAGYRPFTSSFAIGVEGGDWRNHAFGRAHAAVEAVWHGVALDHQTRARLSGAALAGAAPPQHHAFLGGAGTIPGQPFRAWSGRGFALAEAEHTRDLLRPWVALRLFAAAGMTFDPHPAVASEWNAPATAGVRGGAGVGVALLHGIIRIDVAHGIRGGGPALLLAVDPRLRRWL